MGKSIQSKTMKSDTGNVLGTFSFKKKDSKTFDFALECGTFAFVNLGMRGDPYVEQVDYLQEGSDGSSISTTLSIIHMPSSEWADKQGAEIDARNTIAGQMFYRWNPNWNGSF